MLTTIVSVDPVHFVFQGSEALLLKYQRKIDSFHARIRLSFSYPIRQRSLRSGEASDRNPERRTGHVVERDLMAERDRRGISAVLAADADLQLLPRLPATLDADLHQFADAFGVDGDERVTGDDPALSIDPEEARRIVARNSERRLRKVIGSEGEKLRRLSNLLGLQSSARKLDHRADLIV